MFTNLSTGAVITAVAFAVVSVIFCLVQIFLRKKVNFLILCKVTVYVPLLILIIIIMTGMAQGLVAISEANA